MSDYWIDTFRKRMVEFGHRRPPHEGEIPVSIKIGVSSGCFHREHSPHAYAMIDRHLSSLSPDDIVFEFEEHESGPEILVYLAVASAGITLAKSVIDLITVIVKARSEGIRKGDRPRDALKLIIRRTHGSSEFAEEEMHIESHEASFEIHIEERLSEAAKKLLESEAPKRKSRRKKQHD